jgi:hypothetical protein
MNPNEHGEIADLRTCTHKDRSSRCRTCARASSAVSGDRHMICAPCASM